MGQFKTTCALTHLPINENDSVVMVAADISAKIFLADRLPLNFLSDIISWSYLTHIVKGRYDSYGWIKELPRTDDEATQYCLFTHAVAWRATVDFARKQRLAESQFNSSIQDQYDTARYALNVLDKRVSKEFPELEPFTEFKLVHLVATLGRRNLWSLSIFDGGQAPFDATKKAVYKHFLDLMGTEFEKRS